MKKILVTTFIFFSIIAQAQKKAAWQVVFETKAIFSSSPDKNYGYTDFYLIDSASNLFKKYNSGYRYSNINRTKLGVSAGIRFCNIITKNINLTIGALISHYSAEKTNTRQFNSLDSTQVTLQRTSIGWYDPVTNKSFYSGQPVFGNSTFYSLSQQFYFGSTPRSYSIDKVNFTSFEIPISIEYKIKESGFSISGGFCPIFVMQSSAERSYLPNPEIIPPANTTYAITSLLWQLDAGISYNVNQKLQIGFNYKRMLNSILDNVEIIRISSFGFHTRFLIPKNHIK